MEWVKWLNELSPTALMGVVCVVIVLRVEKKLDSLTAAVTGLTAQVAAWGGRMNGIAAEKAER